MLNDRFVGLVKSVDALESKLVHEQVADSFLKRVTCGSFIKERFDSLMAGQARGRIFLINRTCCLLQLDEVRHAVDLELYVDPVEPLPHIGRQVPRKTGLTITSRTVKK
ncbi:hypothetical protein QTL95_17195 [Rhizobium sp. S152]|uniref:hypothetical protein n=1 Tax=Rhizobium sp. S152 TaxID=3055038 RepID=UPI0025A95A89|nr:hypothetical protein [Rhizobium sp. S152]MDM9627641.1 hypothetical protein [Rhizobium sp. S152]